MSANPQYTRPMCLLTYLCEVEPSCPTNDWLFPVHSIPVKEPVSDRDLDGQRSRSTESYLFLVYLNDVDVIDFVSIHIQYLKVRCGKRKNQLIPGLLKIEERLGVDTVEDTKVRRFFLIPEVNDNEIFETIARHISHPDVTPILGVCVQWNGYFDKVVAHGLFRNESGPKLVADNEVISFITVDVSSHSTAGLKEIPPWSLDLTV